MRYSRTLIAFVLALLFVAAGVDAKRRPHLVLLAQTVPYTATFTWNPNPASDNVTSYTVSLDGTTVTTVLPSACSATVCSAALPIPAFGAHTASVFASNTNLSGGTGVTGSSQNGPSSSIPFSLNKTPVTPAGSALK